MRSKRALVWKLVCNIFARLLKDWTTVESTLKLEIFYIKIIPRKASNFEMKRFASSDRARILVDGEQD